MATSKKSSAKKPNGTRRRTTHLAAHEIDQLFDKGVEAIVSAAPEFAQMASWRRRLLGFEQRKHEERVALARAIHADVLAYVVFPGVAVERRMIAYVEKMNGDLSVAERRASVVASVRGYDSVEDLRRELVRADAAFAAFTDGDFVKALGGRKGTPRRATHLGACSVAAKLSLRAGAFGDGLHEGETRAHARARIAEVFKKACARSER